MTSIHYVLYLIHKTISYFCREIPYVGRLKGQPFSIFIPHVRRMDCKHCGRRYPLLSSVAKTSLRTEANHAVSSHLVRCARCAGLFGWFDRMHLEPIVSCITRGIRLQHSSSPSQAEVRMISTVQDWGVSGP